jgi:DNA-binding response OmpR family regulator
VDNVAKILIIDDEAEIRNVVRLGLTQHQVLQAENGLQGLLTAVREKPDLILLDVNMPGIDGFEVCRRLRADDDLANVPVVFTTFQNSLSARLEGFDAGADDYLVKPFDLLELEVRVRAILRRVQPVQDVPETTLKVGQLELNLLSREATTPAGTNLLTATEFTLLKYFLTHADELLTTSRLLEDVWDYPPGVGDPALVRMHVRNLREKLELDPSNPVLLQTIGRQGYTVKNRPN